MAKISQPQHPTILTSKSSNWYGWYYLLLGNTEPQLEVPEMRESWLWEIVIENNTNGASLSSPTGELSYWGSSPAGN